MEGSSEKLGKFVGLDEVLGKNIFLVKFGIIGVK